jgi:hypothetical protein
VQYTVGPFDLSNLLLVTLMFVRDGVSVLNLDVQLHAGRICADYSVIELKLPSLSACDDAFRRPKTLRSLKLMM